MIFNPLNANAMYISKQMLDSSLFQALQQLVFQKMNLLT